MILKRIIGGFFCIALTVFTCYVQAQTTKKTAIKKKPAATVTKPVPKPPFATASEIEDGKNLIAKADCLACHKIAEKLVGPAYVAVAQKYPQDQNSVDLLTKKVISGGSGVWGAVPMTPHPAIAAADANKMIKYILTLNSNNTTTASSK